jgi:hypothetical protein
LKKKNTPLSSYLGLAGGMKEKGEKIIFFFFIFFLFSLKLRLRFDLGVVWVNISEGKLYINLFGKKSRDQISRNRETINLKRKGEESCKKILILFQVQVSG